MDQAVDEAQYIANLYGRMIILIQEMEAGALALVINRTHGTERILSLAAPVELRPGPPERNHAAAILIPPGGNGGWFR